MSILLYKLFTVILHNLAYLLKTFKLFYFHNIYTNLFFPIKIYFIPQCYIFPIIFRQNNNSKYRQSDIMFT